jgi:outer membrane protein assembly factor BamB
MLPHAALLAALASPAPQDWPHWRGPGYDGASAVEGLPASLEEGRGVLWAAEMPGPSAATPIVLGEHVDTTAAVEDAGLLLALCLDRDSGEVVWEDAAGSGYRPGGRGSETRIDNRSDYASPSPVADAEGVVFLFGNGDLVAYDHAGERVWARNLQEDHGDFAFQWTYGASPTLVDGRVVLPILQRDQPTARGVEAAEPIPSFLLALERGTGAEAFRVLRPSDARMESLESYATVIPRDVPAGGRELLVVGGDVLTGHDPASGKELWRWGTWNEGHREQWWRNVPTPVVGGGRVLVCAPKRAPVYALEIDGEGLLGPDTVAWQSEGRRDPVSSDVPTPLYYRGSFYVLSERGALSKVDPASGKVAWSAELPDRSAWEASPCGADGRVWCISHAGVLAAVDADSGEVVLTAALGGEEAGEVRSSVAAAHGSLFVRTRDRLLRLGEE